MPSLKNLWQCSDTKHRPRPQEKQNTTTTKGNDHNKGRFFFLCPVVCCHLLMMDRTGRAKDVQKGMKIFVLPPLLDKVRTQAYKTNPSEHNRTQAPKPNPSPTEGRFLPFAAMEQATGHRPTDGRKPHRTQGRHRWTGERETIKTAYPPHPTAKPSP